MQVTKFLCKQVTPLACSALALQKVALQCIMGAESSVKQLHCLRFHAHIILPTIRRCEWTAAWTQYFPFISTEGLKAGKQLNAASQDEIKGIRLPVERRAGEKEKKKKSW